MPHPSDNLDSANDDESDHESFSNELSPTDGFFQPSPIASSGMVPDPSLDRKDAAEEDKVLIPRSETRNESGGTSRSATSPTLQQLFPSQNYASSQLNSRPGPAPSSSSNTPTTPELHRRTDTTLFFEPRNPIQGPPPAYTPSSPTTSSHSNHNNRSYSTFEPQRSERSMPIPPTAEPQSMGMPEEGVDERAPLVSDAKKPSRRRICIQKFLFIALVFAVVTGIMTTLANLKGNTRDSKLPGGKLPEGTNPPDLGLPDESSGSYCAAATIHKRSIIFDFAVGEKLSVMQVTHENDSRSRKLKVRTSGEIRIRRLPASSNYGSRGVVLIDTYVSDDSLEVSTTWVETLRTMKVSVPSSASVGTYNNCISLEITIWLPEDALFPELVVAATVLNLRVVDGVQFKVTGETKFASVSGDVYFPDYSVNNEIPPTTYPLDTRHITVETVSGNIKGIYPLFDLLKLSSQSGDIQAGVYPQPVLPSQPAPANLEISTSSGKIQIGLPVQVPRYSPPARDYVTHVSSISGNILGSYFLGSIGSLKSTSGDITIMVLPVVPFSPSTDPDDGPKTRFETWSISGTHDLDILEPVFIALAPSEIASSPYLPKPPNAPNDPTPVRKPSPHHSQEPYIPVAGDDPYRVSLPSEETDDVILHDVTPAKMAKRRRAVAKQWRTLTASHKTSSAEIKLRYPVAWEGTVAESTISGDTKTVGKDLKLISYNKGWPYKELIAGKGVSKRGEGSSVSMDSISGSLIFAVGEEA